MELIVFRLANYETPLWSVENFAAARYNAADAGFTQYLSLHPLTPWAELLRNEDRRTREQAGLMRYPLWALRLQFDEPPLELTFDTAAEFGLNAEDLVADEHGPCRALAQAFRDGGPKAFIAPSTALAGTKNLIVLEPHVVVPFNQVPIDEIDWPGSLTSQDGRCPEGLWDLVHYRATGTKHGALEAWEKGEDFMFEEPRVSTSSLAAQLGPFGFHPKRMMWAGAGSVTLGRVLSIKETPSQLERDQTSVATALFVDVGVRSLLMGEARKRVVTGAFGIPRGDQSLLVRMILIGAMATVLRDLAPRPWPRPSGADAAIGSSLLNATLRGIAGPPSRNMPIAGALIALGLLSHSLRPAIAGSAREVHALAREVRAAFGARYRQ